MADLAAPPVLSTPDDHILDVPAADAVLTSTLSDDALRSTYEIDRTAGEIVRGAWRTIALQFPDHMLVDAPRVVELLGRELAARQTQPDSNSSDSTPSAPRIHILADTSYSACCVDEVAAEHADAQVVVHYGRTCLSPTSRLPVVYVYTSHPLDHAVALDRFAAEFPDPAAEVVVMADLTYQDHVEGLVSELRGRGYVNVCATEVVRDPAAVIPNRRIREPALDDDSIRRHALFHISDPPAALLLALQSRFASLHVLSTSASTSPSVDNPTLRTMGLLRRRFARVLSLASAGVVGILVNTLSVANYLASVDLLRAKIARAGKKSYTVVVGKLNPAKLANFAEIEGWVVIGCWESGLVEEDAGYWRPVVTPFEMEVALMSEEERTWGGEWWAGIEKLRAEDAASEVEAEVRTGAADVQARDGQSADNGDAEDDIDGDESLPPQFDLRTGKLVSHSRPMQLTVRSASGTATGKGEAEKGDGATPKTGSALARRAAGELASINGVASPGAEYLRSQRTWQGLGSDFGAGEASTAVEEGRRGLARGYTVGEAEARR
ncbi:Diphthamide biosynthesis protein 2 [Purpureocillium takamizusanense]|uniref:2-(3-amino-3-carboxypropyl)histidine synthase subunit 2 n=1 Tax=Purpureocillium takamizusanense TaxID=2060973 RepID=A0A9Q8VHJ6_9HYPO|nr:Diphthamide biosynthesis protein 2 [Purpureocillium takamizusanense]UNI24887.1 Diphthamide biosynthesis protein 2 [Purpureocillium takamizusanense]